MTASAKRRMDATVFALAGDRVGVYSNGRKNRSFEGARLVMVDGLPIGQAVRLCGVRAQGIYKAMRRIEQVFTDMGICPRCGLRQPLV